jgi:hypothetical protein
MQALTGWRDPSRRAFWFSLNSGGSYAMYSMVLMAAMLPTGDAASFGKKGGCNGGCSGAVASCHGGGFLGLHKSNCCGGGSGFLGHKEKSGCCGGGFLGLHKSKSHSSGCTGTPAPTCGCCGSGAAAVPPPPVVMPKEDPKPMPKPEPKPKPKGD